MKHTAIFSALISSVLLSTGCISVFSAKEKRTGLNEVETRYGLVGFSSEQEGAFAIFGEGDEDDLQLLTLFKSTKERPTTQSYTNVLNDVKKLNEVINSLFDDDAREEDEDSSNEGEDESDESGASVSTDDNFDELLARLEAKKSEYEDRLDELKAALGNANE